MIGIVADPYNLLDPDSDPKFFLLLRSHDSVDLIIVTIL